MKPGGEGEALGWPNAGRDGVGAVDCTGSSAILSSPFIWKLLPNTGWLRDGDGEEKTEAGAEENELKVTGAAFVG